VRHDEDEIIRMFGSGEARVRPRQSISLRVFVHFHEKKVVSLLGGYDKGKDASRLERSKRPGRTSRAGETVNARKKAQVGPVDRGMGEIP
jgi:hypothetical protein